MSSNAYGYKFNYHLNLNALYLQRENTNSIKLEDSKSFNGLSLGISTNYEGFNFLVSTNRELTAKNKEKFTINDVQAISYNQYNIDSFQLGYYINNQLLIKAGISNVKHDSEIYIDNNFYKKINHSIVYSQGFTILNKDKNFSLFYIYRNNDLKIKKGIILSIGTIF